MLRSKQQHTLNLMILGGRMLEVLRSYDFVLIILEQLFM